MHARIDQLLSLRDGEPVEAETRVHVQQCAHCQAEAARLVAMRSDLQSLPAVSVSTDLWPQIAAQAAARPSPRMRAIAAAAAAVVVGAVGFVALRDISQPPQMAREAAVESSPATVVTDNELQTLIAQSRELDELLQYLPQRPHIERVSLAATVDSIEERIQVLDWQLAHGSDAGLDQRQARRLWSERVELMDSLVKVRYAESAPMVF